MKIFILIVLCIFFFSCDDSTGPSDYTGPYHGNCETKVFHKSSCRYYNCEQCTCDFSTRSEAINAGYSPCGVCNP